MSLLAFPMWPQAPPDIPTMGAGPWVLLRTWTPAVCLRGSSRLGQKLPVRPLDTENAFGARSRALLAAGRGRESSREGPGEGHGELGTALRQGRSGRPQAPAHWPRPRALGVSLQV